MIAHGTPDGLKRVVGGQTLHGPAGRPGRLATSRRSLAERRARRRVAERGAAERAGRRRRRAADVVARLAAADIAVTEISLRLPSLDEVFLALTGHGPQPRRGGRMTAIAAPVPAQPRPGTRPTRPPRSCGTALALAWRNLIVKITPQPGGAARRHAAADHLPAAVRLHLRRRDRRRLAARLPAVPAARRPGADDRVRVGGHRREPQHRHREGHLRPLPQPADRPQRAAGRRDPRRPRPLR